jgi:hypothetical protein
LLGSSFLSYLGTFTTGIGLGSRVRVSGIGIELVLSLGLWFKLVRHCLLGSSFLSYLGTFTKGIELVLSLGLRVENLTPNPRT